jgi:hypothetical protein
MMSPYWRTGLAAALCFAWTGLVGIGPAVADKIKNPTAVFSGLDKITGRIISFEVAVNETVQFGSLQITPKVCYTRPPTETPNTTAFVDVEEVTFQNERKRAFEGWMFASSPGLHGIENPVYDVWLTDCKGGTEIIAEPKEPDPVAEALKRDADAANPPQTPSQPPAQPQQPRPRRQAQPVPPPPSQQQGLPQPGDGFQRVPIDPRQPSRRYFPSEEPADGGLRPPGDIGPLR